jgi:hypothetical protein
MDKGPNIANRIRYCVTTLPLVFSGFNRTTHRTVVDTKTIPIGRNISKPRHHQMRYRKT